MIEELEKKLKPLGEVSLIGCGRLGVRVAFDLLEVHRGGVKKLYIFDSAKIDENDIIHRKLGGKVGEYKVDFAKRFFNERVEAYRVDINEDNLNLIKGNVAIICIAGGDTLKITKKIVEYCFNNNIKPIGTNGVFGIEENVKVSDAKYTRGPAKLLNLDKEGFTVVGTERFIKDFLPITPYTLDEMAKKIVLETLKVIYGKYGYV